MAKKNNIKTNNKSQFTGKPNKSPQKRQSPITYTKHFADFAHAADEIVNIPGYINSSAMVFFDDISDSKSLNDMQDFLISLYHGNIPDPVHRTNTFWALNLSVERAFLKTGNSFGIGWVITMDKGTNIIVDIAVNYRAYRPSYCKPEIEYLLDNEWRIAEETKEN